MTTFAANSEKSDAFEEVSVVIKAEVRLRDV